MEELRDKIRWAIKRFLEDNECNLSDGYRFYSENTIDELIDEFMEEYGG